MDWHLYVGLGVVGLGAVGAIIWAVRPARSSVPFLSFWRRPLVKPFDPVALKYYEENAEFKARDESPHSK